MDNAPASGAGNTGSIPVGGTFWSPTHPKIMPGYYQNVLAAERLELCYKLAPPRVRQYLQAEIDHVVKQLPSQALILELGCGYGRILAQLIPCAERVCGVDTSLQSLKYGKQILKGEQNCELVCADAAQLPFRANSFDVVLCLQNGISAFQVDPYKLVRESLRVSKPNGTTLFSTYAEQFWEYRMQWFDLQAHAGLIGPLDYERTGDGKIVCADGFTATTLRADDFRALADMCHAETSIYGIDESSLFCSFKSRT